MLGSTWGEWDRSRDWANAPGYPGTSKSVLARTRPSSRLLADCRQTREKAFSSQWATTHWQEPSIENGAHMHIHIHGMALSNLVNSGEVLRHPLPRAAARARKRTHGNLHMASSLHVIPISLLTTTWHNDGCGGASRIDHSEDHHHPYERLRLTLLLAEGCSRAPR